VWQLFEKVSVIRNHRNSSDRHKNFSSLFSVGGGGRSLMSNCSTQYSGISVVGAKLLPLSSLTELKGCPDQLYTLAFLASSEEFLIAVNPLYNVKESINLRQESQSTEQDSMTKPSDH